VINFCGEWQVNNIYSVTDQRVVSTISEEDSRGMTDL
jgi:hypothetical protein